MDDATAVEDVDLLVVGGGKAGKTLAMESASAGAKVAMIERSMIGGTCINVACIPTKTLINSGRVFDTIRRAREFGVAGVDDVHVDIDLLRHRKEDVVGTMVAGQRKAFIGSGMDFIMGEATFVAERTVQVELNDGGVRMLRGADVVVDLGTEPALPPIKGLATSSVQTSNTILRLTSLPASIVILGGGYIGCEYADLLAGIGVDVTLVQGPAHLLPREDVDVSALIEAQFEKAGITLHLGARAQQIARTADGRVTVTLASGDTVSADDILVALGRTPMTAGAGLERAGVQLDERGYIVTDEYLRTDADHVWAAGDVAGTPQFTHASYDDYRVLSTNLAAAGEASMRSTRGRLIPYCVFTTPELGRVGMTEAEARAAGHDVRIARMPVAAIPRARTVGHLDGSWKAVIDRPTGQILGAALLGTESSEAITVVQVALQAGMDYARLRDTIITHPTMAEGFTLLFTPAYLEP
ncbi:mercuric reductase [Microbacterium kribbense]|uniref:Mercuric reductase n=1 Tax=Microbacterium kribbense TaxID=433645 RepID=A0ABP7G3J1_9MICO